MSWDSFELPLQPGVMLRVYIDRIARRGMYALRKPDASRDLVSESFLRIPFFFDEPGEQPIANAYPTYCMLGVGAAAIDCTLEQLLRVADFIGIDVTTFPPVEQPA